MEGVVGDGAPVDKHFAAVGRVVPHEKFEDRRFAGTRMPHHAEELTFLNLERNAVEHLHGRVWIGEVHLVEFHRLDTLFKCDGIGVVNDGGLEVNGGEDAPCGSLSPLELIDQDAEDEHRHRHPSADEEEGDQLSRGDFTLAGKVATGGRQQPESHARHGVDHGDESIAIGAGAHGLVPVGAGFGGDPIGLPLLCVVSLHHSDAGDEVFKHRVNVARRFPLLPVLALHASGKPVHGGHNEDDGCEEHRSEFPRH